METPVTHLTTADLAARWRCKPQTIRLMRHRGSGPQYIRLGTSLRSRVLYAIHHIEEFEQAQTFPHTCAEQFQDKEGAE